VPHHKVAAWSFAARMGQLPEDDMASPRVTHAQSAARKRREARETKSGFFSVLRNSSGYLYFCHGT